MKVVLVQPRIPHYRLPVFRALAQLEGWELTICHGGTQLCGKEPFTEVHLDPRHTGPFVVWPGFRDFIAGADVAILCFDAHYVQHVAASFGRAARRVVLWGHGFGRNGIGNLVRTAMARHVGAMLLYDEISIPSFREVGVPDSRLFVAPNTVHVGSPPRAETEGRRQEFLFVGTLSVRKRVDQLIRALPAVRARTDQSITLRIVGDGPELSRLRELVDELELHGAVVFESVIADERALKNRFDATIALICPGAVGLVVLHAFAFGVPVVTTRYAYHGPERSNLIDGVNSVLFDGSDEGLIQVMTTLANEPDKAERLGLAGLHHYCSSRTLAHMVAGFQAAIDRVSPHSESGKTSRRRCLESSSI